MTLRGLYSQARNYYKRKSPLMNETKHFALNHFERISPQAISRLSRLVMELGEKRFVELMKGMKNVDERIQPNGGLTQEFLRTVHGTTLKMPADFEQFMRENDSKKGSPMSGFRVRAINATRNFPEIKGGIIIKCVDYVSATALLSFLKNSVEEYNSRISGPKGKSVMIMPPIHPIGENIVAMPRFNGITLYELKGQKSKKSQEVKAELEKKGFPFKKVLEEIEKVSSLRVRAVRVHSRNVLFGGLGDGRMIFYPLADFY